MSANGDLHDAAATLRRHFGPLRPTSWAWRPVAFGPCVRCRWPAHTLAGGSPYHPFCWLNPDEPGSFDQWVLRKDGAGEWANRADALPQPAGDRQWCGTQGAWFQPTPERLAVCAAHAEEMTARWSRDRGV